MRTLFTLVCVLALSASATADMLLLKDGRIIEGRDLTRRDGGIEVAFDNGTVFVPSTHIETAILEGAGAWVPETEEEKAKAAEGLVPFEGDWISAKKRDGLIAKRIAERRELIEEIRAHSKWVNRWQEKSKYFHFQYTIPNHIFEPYRDAMEAYFKEFAKTWRIRQPRDVGPLSVCFYTDRKQFNQVGGVSGGVIGYFRFVQPWDLNFYYDRVDPELTEDVMFHETNHYLQKLINVDFSYPHFPGESLAEYYGSAEWNTRTKKLTVGLMQAGRLTEIEADIASGDMMSLKKIVSEDMYQDYNWGWSLVHFLMETKGYQKKFVKFFRALANDGSVERKPMSFQGLSTCTGDEVWKQFCKYLGLTSDEKIEKLQEEWHEYVKGLTKSLGVRGYEAGGFAAMRSHPSRPIRARRLFETAIEKGSSNPLVFHRYAELLMMKGERAEAITQWRKAIELDPLNSEFYADLGHALALGGTKDEGIKLMKLAIELDPDNPFLTARVEMLLRD